MPAREADLVLADVVLHIFRPGRAARHGQEATWKRSLCTSMTSSDRLPAQRRHLERKLLLDHSARCSRPRSRVLAQLVARGSLCACVTFVDELATASEATISMVAAVHPDDPAVRTYKIVPKPPGGPAYAAALAERYGLTYGAVSDQVAG